METGCTERVGDELDAGWLPRFSVPAFEPHRWLRGGHLQTLVAAKPRGQDTVVCLANRSAVHEVPLADGDRLVLHDDSPPGWEPEHGAVLLLHGICGCHQAGYLLRFYRRLCARGIRTFRLDMRGCGASASLCRQITHAGRSEDVLAAVERIAQLIDPTRLRLGIAGVSLGGNQLLRLAGELGGEQPVVKLPPRESLRGWPAVRAILAIAPPVDLQACSDAMQARRLRFYNRYFIRYLLQRSTPELRARPAYRAAVAAGPTRTLREFDRRFTAPLAGFENERDYYARCSAAPVISQVDVPTLIVAAADDPLVPVDVFERLRNLRLPDVRIHIEPTGGHHGFLQRDRSAWTDDLVEIFFQAAFR